jgi:hypothetical protein
MEQLQTRDFQRLYQQEEKGNDFTFLLSRSDILDEEESKSIFPTCPAVPYLDS